MKLTARVIKKLLQMKKILVVDDDDILRKLLKNYLEKQGYQVIDAVSGKEGLTIFNQDQPDLVVSDFSIPDMDGLDFCTQLRSQLEGQLIPFIFLSSQGDLKDYFINNIEQITKPFDLEELLVKVEALLERSDSVRQQTPIKREKTQIIKQLTPAEEKVFWQVIQGLTNREISKHLFISHRTVQTHLSNILAKLGLENRRQLVKFAYEQGYGEVKHHE